jgi:hypothetical protein
LLLSLPLKSSRRLSLSSSPPRGKAGVMGLAGARGAIGVRRGAGSRRDGGREGGGRARGRGRRIVPDLSWPRKRAAARRRIYSF